MENSCIGIGKLSSNHLYLLYHVIFRFLRFFILSFSSIKENIKFGLFLFQPEITKHTLIKLFYKYIGFIIFGKIFANYQKKNKNKNNKKTKVNNELIYNDKMGISSASLKRLFIIGVLYVVFEISIQISYSIGINDFDLWTFNIVFALLFMSCFFSIHIYNHQKYSLVFIVLIDLVLTILAGFFPIKNNSYNIVESLCNNKLYSIAFFIFYIINSLIISFSRVLGKVLMELKFISSYSIIIIIGIIGFILTSILLAIVSIFKCGSSEKYEIICSLNEINTKNNITLNYTYYDSIPLYFKNLKNKKNLYFFIEVIIINPLYTIISFFEFNYELLIIYYLNPIYILICDSIYFGSISLLSFLLNYKGNKNVKSILNLFANLIALFGYSIYLEIIELKFCKLNNNLRKNIIERSRIDSEIEINGNDYENSEDDEDEVKDKENHAEIELIKRNEE